MDIRPSNDSRYGIPLSIVIYSTLYKQFTIELFKMGPVIDCIKHRCGNCWFDFLIKSLRAGFIDTASKTADLEISRRLFENLQYDEQRQKTGAMAGTIREFETLREFSNSSH